MPDLHLGCLLTDSRRYGRRATSHRVVHCTWQGTLYDEPSLPDDWHRSPGILGRDAPPGETARSSWRPPAPSPTPLTPAARVRKLHFLKMVRLTLPEVRKLHFLEMVCLTLPEVIS